MHHNRLIQLVATGIALACLLGATLLVPSINQQRRDLQIGAESESMPDMPAKYAIIKALGSFQGLAVDVLWQRAERLKQEGKLFESNTLARLITTLQPRFPQVWSFQAWNMAYNISVITHTPDERWDWVDKGIRLIREEGIVYNPNAIRLYRELGWIFFHKVGGNSDDMHWYYKQQMAREWHQVLGAPTEGATTEEAVNQFGLIAAFAERYFALDEPTREVRSQLEALAETAPELKDKLDGFQRLKLIPFHEKLVGLKADLVDRHSALVRRLDSILKQLSERRGRAERDSLTLFYEDNPMARLIIERFSEAGLAMNVSTLRMLGRLIMFLQYSSPGQFERLTEDTRLFGEADRQLAQIILDSDLRPDLIAVRTYLQAMVLKEHYHMDPLKMYELMVYLGPLDWRHPASHAAYWSNLGVERSGYLRDNTKIDVLNTERQVIHSMQQLMRFGRVSFDPFSGQIDLLPDPRFIKSYEKVVFDAWDRTRQVEWVGKGNPESFESGHENFLLSAIVLEFLYGRVENAQAYYDEVRTKYGHKNLNLQTGRYLQSLFDLVIAELKSDWQTSWEAPMFIRGMIFQAIRQGLANDRADVFTQYIRIAQKIHEEYQKARDYETLAPEQRLQMKDFGRVVSDTYVDFMKDPRYAIPMRVRVHRNSPLLLARETYSRFRDTVHTHCDQLGLDGTAAFPAPPGFVDRELTPEGSQPSKHGTIERF